MDIYLYHFNNYYNRRLKLYPALKDYEDYEVYRVYSVNFNPNDGVITEHVIGADSPYNGTADYAIIIEDNQIISRWFIIENQRIRGGQHRLVLKRDTIADFASTVLAAPCFVEKGWVPDSDPAIFNSENMTFNQIKKKEILLTDATNSAWIVGYYDRDKTLTATVPTIEYSADYIVNGIDNWEYYDSYQAAKSRISTIDLNLFFKTYYFSVGITRGYLANYTIASKYLRLNEWDLDPYGSWIGYTDYHYTINFDDGDNPGIKTKALTELTHQLGFNNTDIYNAAESLLPGYITKIDYESLLDFSDGERTVFDSATGILYKIGVKLNQGLTNTSTDFTRVPLTSTLGYDFYDSYSQTGGYITGSRPTKDTSATNFEIRVRTYDTIQLTLEPINTLATSLTIAPGASGKPLYSPYGIFAIPYTDNLRIGKTGDSSINFTMSKSLAMRVVNALIEAYGGTGGELYDVQLLPYCPIPEVVRNVSGVNNVRLLLDDVPEYLYSFITDQDNNKLGICFNCRNTSVKTTKSYVINTKDLKISNETEFCRLISPNWNGAFEFSPAKNRGVEYFEIDMELKPFSPYIHVVPKWNEDGLYGTRSGDAVGLICGGDFGLTMLNDAWAQYERQNKNYQAIFDRNIQNLEVQHRYQRVGEIAGAAVGTVQGATSGAMTGAMIGGGYGAAAGAVIGGVSSAAGGVIDYTMAEELRSEAIEYTKDLFGFQLGNIRALPDSLTKVNSFNPNNKIFPFIEFYGCTSEETEALKNKIKYNGMSIGRIGALQDFINPDEETYIKGQLILLDIEEDSHIVNDISAEIYKGVRV